MKSVEIEILGKKYFLKTDEPEKLLELASFLESQLEELYEKYKTAEQHKLLILNSLMILEQLFQTKDDKKELEKKLEKINGLLELDIK